MKLICWVKAIYFDLIPKWSIYLWLQKEFLEVFYIVAYIVIFDVFNTIVSLVRILFIYISRDCQQYEWQIIHPNRIFITIFFDNMYIILSLFVHHWSRDHRNMISGLRLRYVMFLWNIIFLWSLTKNQFDFLHSVMILQNIMR